MGRTMFRAAAYAAIFSASTLNAALAQTQAPAANAWEPAPPVSAGDSEAIAALARRAASQPAQPIPLQAPGNESQPVEQTIYNYGQPHPHNGLPHSQTVTVHHPHYVPSPIYLPPEAPGVTPTGYPYLNAPLYPCPVPWVPYQVGATVITNQAFYPHEMLYPHKYRAMYPPYYYQVDGCWKVLPWGVSQSEKWRLKGTVVKVKYSSAIGLCSGFTPPALP